MLPVLPAGAVPGQTDNKCFIQNTKQGVLKHMQRTKNKALYELKGRLSPLQALPFSLQQILAMFVTNIVPIGIVAAAANICQVRCPDY